MIVDLVRNDMSRFSKAGSVKVKELCEVYPFKQVHQMISTIESELENNIKIHKIIEGTFPMGSMTGAPKIMSMQKIEEYEEFKEAESQLQLEYKKVQFELSERDLSFWSVDPKSWQVEPAEYIFEVGASAGDIRESASVWLG